MERKVKYAEELRDRYEAEGKYNEMPFDEYVKKEISICDANMKKAIMEDCPDEATAIDEFVMMCLYLYK